MIGLRKIDYYGQIGVGVLMIVSIPFLFFIGFFYGLFLLGTWQLLSACINTNTFLANGLHRQIKLYWLFVALVFAVLILCYPLSMMQEEVATVICFIALIGSVRLAAYYSTIYKRLINHLLLRKELGGVIKSNHGS